MNILAIYLKLLHFSNFRHAANQWLAVAPTKYRIMNSTIVRKISTFTFVKANLRYLLEYLYMKAGLEFFSQPWQTGVCQVVGRNTYNEGAPATLGLSTENSGSYYLTFETGKGQVAISVCKTLYDCMIEGTSVKIMWQVSRINGQNLNGKLAPSW